MLRGMRARLGYRVARRLMGWRWAVQQPKLWRWMEGQFSRMAALGDVSAQSFYGHILVFRGRGFGARNEGIRLLRLAAKAGDAKAAYQMGAISLSEDASHGPDAAEAANWWALAAQAGHPLAATRLAQLYRAGGHGLKADPEQARRYEACAAKLGL
ncbi:sel1 repeat family protein [Stutzerimonas nosocomialis]|uniref:sel1 repeat family protein n=1 Tax=Stutzerimonas nosocomialis TaxID=1056496 RepID=UPI00110838D1|nr:sel1 repeat family protein [Stutzerimonas nosocomialis]TLX59528.1 sel1 repeat family protein [Stutzerimonas nosocomialis]TLX60474.1 sel1 repeat family protein [Stutzerimonas nosocomialis]